MTLKPKNKFKGVSYFLIFAVFSSILVFSDDGIYYNFYVSITSFIVCIISLYQIFIRKGFNFSLHQIVHLFFLFFLGIAPVQQFKKNIVLWGSTSNFNSDDYIFGNLIFIASLLLFNFFHYFLTAYKPNKEQDKKNTNLKMKPKRIFLLGLSIFALVLFLYSKNFDLFSIFLRGSFNSGGSSVGNSSLSLIINNFIRPMPAIVLFTYKFFNPNKTFSLYEFLLISIVLVCDFPLGMPRFLAASLYIPLALIYIKVLRVKYNFAFVFCLGFLVVFPFLDQFRYASEITSNVSIGVDTSMFSGGNFDTYQNTLTVIDKEIVTNGNQLMGVVLFFVPRSIWPNKPIGSGAFIAEKLYFEFSNISMSLVGEGYLNFGFLGVFLFMFLLAMLVKRFDFVFWSYKNSVDYKLIIYMYLQGLLFFILRGDLLSSFAYTVGISSAVILVTKVGFRKIRK